MWRELLALKTDPVFGVGFCSIWSDESLLSKLPSWVGASAHNGYLEMYLDGGFVGVFVLGIMLLVTGAKLNRQLGLHGNYSLVRFAIFIAIIVGDFSESHFGRLGPLWFAFLLTALDLPRSKKPRLAESQAEPSSPASEAPDWYSTPVVHS